MSAMHTEQHDCAHDSASSTDVYDGATRFPSFKTGPSSSVFLRTARAFQRTSLGAAGLAARLGNIGTGKIGILLYHRVTPAAAGMTSSMNVPPQNFRAQLIGLLDRGFFPTTLKAALRAHARGEQLPRESFIVTFDDAYECVYDYAFPILAELKVPATVFMATAYLDSQEPFPFDDWADKGTPSPPESWRPLATKQCGEMLQSGWIEIGSHTHTHADFRARPADLQEDISTSLEVLREKFSITEASFAFPYGKKGMGFSGSAMALAAENAGVRCALTTETDLVDLRSSPFDWGRLDVASHDTAATIAGRLSGWYNLARDFGRQAKRTVLARRLPR